MRYEVRFAEDDVMPDGHDWILCREDSEVTRLFVRKSVRQRAAEDVEPAWSEILEGICRMVEGGIPLQREPVDA